MVDRLREAHLLREQRKKEQEESKDVTEDIEMEGNDENFEQQPDYGQEEDWGNEDDWDAAIQDDDDVFQSSIQQEQQKQNLFAKLIDIVIDFCPKNYVHGSILQIQGDMTEWIPVNMKHGEVKVGSAPVFKFNCKVAKGYKYRFWFVQQGQTILDLTKEVCLNQDSIPTHQVIVPAESLTNTPVFHKMENYPDTEVPEDLKMIVEDLTQQYKTQQQIVDKIEQHQRIIQQMREYQALIEIVMQKKDDYEQERLRKKLKEADQEFRSLAQEIQVDIVGRLVHSKSDPTQIYEVKSYKDNFAEITLRAVYDQYQILLKDNNLSSCQLTMKVGQFDKNYQLFDKRQTNFWSKQFLTTDNYIFTLKYSIQKIDKKKECLFHSIQPTRLGFESIQHLMVDYQITQHPTTREVTNIRNRKMGEVKFRAMCIDEGAGYASNSLFQLWTHHNFKLFNIIHIHLNDTSDEVPIDVQYLPSYTYNIKDIQFKKDISGTPLRYKILVYDWKIRDVIYNSGSCIEQIQFQENPVSLDEYLSIGDTFGKVHRVPFALLTYPDKDNASDVVDQKESTYTSINSCDQRQFERLQGMVDFQVLSKNGVETLLEQPELVRCAICKLKKADAEQVQMFQIFSETLKDQNNKNFIDELNNLIENLLADKNSFDNLTIEKNEHLHSFEQIEKSQQKLEELIKEGATIDSYNMERYRNALTDADQKKTKLARLIKFMK